MLFAFISYTIGLVYLYVGGLIIKEAPKSAFSRLFVLVCILLSCYSFLEISKHLTAENGLAIPVDAILRILWITISAMMLDISLFIAHTKWHERNRDRFKIYFHVPGGLFAVYEVLFLHFNQWRLFYDRVEMVELAVTYGFCSASILLFWGRYRVLEDEKQQKPIRKVLIYSFVTVVAMGVNQFALSKVHLFYTSLNQFLVFFFFIGIFYTNYRYRLHKLESLIPVKDVLDRITEMVMFIDWDGNIKGINRRAEKVLGYREDEIDGKRVDEVVNLDMPKVRRKLSFLGSYESERELVCTTIHGDKIPVHANVSAVSANQFGEIAGIVVTLTDRTLVNRLQKEIKERTLKEKQLSYAVTFDSLTGVYNRSFFDQIIHSKAKETLSSLGIVICDIDGLKLINDTFGHDEGDKHLNIAARIMKSSLRGEACLCRIGGDEFAVVMHNCTEEQIEATCRRIRALLEKYNSRNQGMPLSISLGFSYHQGAIENVENLIKEADDYMYREKLQNTQSFRTATLHALAKALEARDFITEGHCERLRRMASELGLRIGLKKQQITKLQLLAQFHDLGKVGVPDSILFKPSALTKVEMVQMQRHSEIGYKIAQAHPDLFDVADLILKHHERWDGKGYPLGISKREIPLECRILAVIDAYDSMVNDRPYRKGMAKKEAIEELKRNAGIQFDPLLVDQFLEMLALRVESIR